MKIHGYCETCHKIKLVHANSKAMVQLALNKPIFGQCDACLERELQAARARHPAYRHKR